MDIVRDPIYQQLNKALRVLIQTEEFKPGTRFLTEREICQRFNVSRTTANKALSNLVSEGILEFKKGVGTFLRAGLLLDYDLHSLVSFTEKALAVKKKPSTSVLEFKKVNAEKLESSVCDSLRILNSDGLYYMERLRLAGKIPVILEYRYVVENLCPALTKADLKQSLYAVWKDKYHLDIAGANQVIRAINLSGQEAELLAVEDGAAGFMVISTGYLGNGRPLWWERTFYRGDAYEFQNRLGKIEKARPAKGTLRIMNE